MQPMAYINAFCLHKVHIFTKINTKVEKPKSINQARGSWVIRWLVNSKNMDLQIINKKDKSRSPNPTNNMYGLL